MNSRARINAESRRQSPKIISINAAALLIPWVAILEKKCREQLSFQAVKRAYLNDVISVG